MKTVRTLMASLVRDDRGATAMEYALIATLIAVSIIGAVGLAGTSIGDLLNSVSGKTSEALSNASNQTD